jgi:hypothetical protein
MRFMTMRPTELHAKLDVFSRSSVYDVDRVSETAARITRLIKAAVVAELLVVDGDWVVGVELVACPSGLDSAAFCGVVGGLSGMADSSWRSRL